LSDFFATRYRQKLLDGHVIDPLHAAFESACEKLACDLVEMGGKADQVHLLASYPSKLTVSVLKPKSCIVTPDVKSQHSYTPAE